jgi:SynChlorMet cassette radical SAM/SPASM protein ScmF
MVSELKGKSEGQDQENLPLINHIYFYLTEGCNLACRHCWVAPSYDPSGDKHSTLPVDLFETAIREAKPLGLSGVKLTGGEPLLHPDFLSLLEIVRHENLSLNIETNGLLCTPEIASSIAKSSKRFVSVSIDGADARTHEWIRGVPGSFEKAIHAVENLVDASTPPQVIMTIMRHNVHQVEDLVKMAEMLGASSVKFNIMQPTARAENLFDSGEALSVEEIIQLQRHIEVDLASKTGMKLHFSSPWAFHPISRIINKETPGFCGIRNIIGVLANGHYALCGIGTSVPELVFGEVGKDRLENIWRNNPILKEVREGLPKRLNGTCARCLMIGSCMGYCIAQNYYSTGKIWTSYWFCEQAERLGIFPKTRLIKLA